MPSIADINFQEDPQSLYGLTGVYPDELPNNTSSFALKNSQVLVSGPARLFTLSVLNTLAGGQFIQLFDAQTLPSDGVAPDWVRDIGTSVGNTFTWGTTGRWFYRGIIVCNSTTAATKTIGAANCFFDAQWV